MKIKHILSILKKINLRNFDNGIDINKSMNQFSKSITNELSDDVEKSNKKAKSREQIDRENLDKIWGKKSKNNSL